MAEILNALVVASVRARFLDYTGTPLTYTAGQIEPASVMPVLATARGYERVMVTSSTGRDLYATIDTGLDAAGTDLSPMFVAMDPKNATDATLKGLLVGLYTNDVANAPGFGSWVVTNPLTGGGKDTVKFELTITDNEGTDHVCVMPVNCTALEFPASGEHGGFNPTFNLIDEPAWS